MLERPNEGASTRRVIPFLEYAITIIASQRADRLRMRQVATLRVSVVSFAAAEYVLYTSVGDTLFKFARRFGLVHHTPI